jgi:hypothetical protein
MSRLADLRASLELLALNCAGNASGCSVGAGEQSTLKDEADLALAAKNWTQASLAAIQAYKTLGSPSDRSLR